MDILSTLLGKKAAAQAPLTQNVAPAAPAVPQAAPASAGGTVTVAHQASPRVGEMAAATPFSMIHPSFPGGTAGGAQAMPAGSPVETAPAAPPPPVEPVTHVPVLADPSGFFKSLDQRLSKILAKSSASANPWAAFDSPLDPASPTGRQGGFPGSPVPNPIDASKHPNFAAGYDMLRKMVLGPSLRVGRKPMGTLTDSYSNAAAPYHTELARIDALAPPQTPGMALLANFAGSLLGGRNPSAESWQNAVNMAGQSVPSLFNR